MFGYFLALRTVTQRPLQYFLEQRDMLEAFMDLEEPSEVEQELVYRDQDYRNLMNLVTHLHDTPEEPQPQELRDRGVLPPVPAGEL